MNFTRYITEWINLNPGKAVGIIVGLALGLLILTFGFIKTLIIILFMLLGFIIGKMVDERISVVEEFKNIFRRKK